MTSRLETYGNRNLKVHWVSCDEGHAASTRAFPNHTPRTQPQKSGTGIGHPLKQAGGGNTIFVGRYTIACPLGFILGQPQDPSFCRVIMYCSNNWHTCTLLWRSPFRYTRRYDINLTNRNPIDIKRTQENYCSQYKQTTAIGEQPVPFSHVTRWYLLLHMDK